MTPDDKHLRFSDSRHLIAQSVELRNRPDELLAQTDLDLAPNTAEKVAARLTQMPSTLRKTYLRALTGTAARSAIRSFCWMCMGWNRKDVQQCTDPACPLFPYRPK